MSRLLRWAGWLSGLTLALELALVLTPLERWWVERLESGWSDRAPEVLLVLGGSEQAPGLMGYSTYLRLHYAVRYWRQGGVRRIVVSGGGTGGASPLAVPMRDFLVANGIPQDAIVMEVEARSTAENIALSMPLMAVEAGSKGFLTSDFHSGRVAGVCRKKGLDWQAVPVPDVRKRWQQLSQRFPVAVELAKETAKRLYYRAKGWI